MRKPTFLVSLLFLLASPAAWAQEDTTLPTLELSEEEEQAWWDDIYRTSEAPDEQATGYTGHGDAADRYSAPGQRAGCICMDGTQQEYRGRGACGGRGGVRFWLYRTDAGELVRRPTNRHHSHPAELSEAEVNNLAAYQPKKAPPARGGEDGQMGLFEWAITLSVCATMIYFIRRILPNHDELLR